MLKKILASLFIVPALLTALPQATLETTQGNIVVELYPDKAPKAVENFITHSKSGYYNGTTFHRIIPNFMIQGGDPLGNGTGGESIWKKPFDDEFSPDLTFNAPGYLAMANRGPSTNGSQFFITTAPTSWLNRKHTIFGKVVGGMDVVRKLEKVPTGAQNKPLETQKILKITVQD
jgi:peptidylprolyl isomerase